jgi:hypothetical protein
MTASTATVVNLSRIEFPGRLLYRGHELGRYVRGLVVRSVPEWQDDRLMRQNPHLGVAVANPAFAGTSFRKVWDDPANLVGLGLSFGTEGHRFLCNAVRKLRPAARLGVDTLALRKDDFVDWKNPVESESDDPDNPYPWGDFPYGGAAYSNPETGRHKVLVATSALYEEEDHMLSVLLAQGLQYIMDLIDKKDRGEPVDHPFLADQW